MVTLHLMRASLTRRWGFYALWAVSLAAAVSGLMVIDVYRASLARTLQVQGAKILSGHVEISARRLITEEERENLTRALSGSASLSHVTEMYAMVTADRDSRLATLRFIDDEYPLVGHLAIGGPDVHGRDLKNRNSIWIAPDLGPLMGLKPGARVKIGDAEFTVAGVITRDSSQTYRIGSMAPKIYLHLDDLGKTGLMRFGSTFKDSIFARVNEPPPADLKARVGRVIKDPAVDVTIPSDLEQGSLRVLSRLIDYLGLVGLVTLALGWIGVYYLGRRWLMLEASAGGLLKCMGLTVREVRGLWLRKLTVVLAFGVLAGGVAAWVLSCAVFPLFKAGLPDDFALVWSWRSSAVLILTGPITGWILLAESAARAARGRALELVAGAPPPRRSGVAWTATVFGVLALAVSLTFLQARSWVVTYSFLAALSGSVILVTALAFACLYAVGILRHSGMGWLWHTATAMWLRRRGLAILLMTVTAICGLLSQLIPHLEATLVGELHAPPETERPALFLFDIQDEQIEPLTELLKNQGAEISQRSPFVRARLIEVNGAAFERQEVGPLSTREEEGNARLRNRGVNLSFRAELGPAERVTQGKSFQALSISPPELSIEEGYADRMGFKLGDELAFDIQGVEIKAKIANLREVNWDSFEPNFFIQLKPGLIDAAPKTWVITVKRHPRLTPPDLQKLVARDFPNVTSVNVLEAIDTISRLLGQLGAGLRIASRLSLALGLFVFVMVLVFQLVSSERDWTQLFRQGLRQRDILGLQLAAFGSLSALGAALGSALSLVVCWALARWTFHARPRFDWHSSWRIFALTCVLSVGALILLSVRLFNRTRSKSRFDAA